MHFAMLQLLGYSNHLKTGLVWYSNGRFVSGYQMVQYLSGGLKTGLKKACLWSKVSSIWMFNHVTWLYHLNTGRPYYPVFRCLVFRWLLYLPHPTNLANFWTVIRAIHELRDAVLDIFDPLRPLHNILIPYSLCPGVMLGTPPPSPFCIIIFKNSS